MENKKDRFFLRLLKKFCYKSREFRIAFYKHEMKNSDQSIYLLKIDFASNQVRIIHLLTRRIILPFKFSSIVIVPMPAASIITLLAISTPCLKLRGFKLQK